MSIFSNLFNNSDRDTKDYFPIVEEINSLEESVKDLSGEDIKKKSRQLRSEHKKGKSLDDILPLTFALTREAAKRTLHQRHYDVQLLGGISLHKGNIAEMKTGEGKTLSATLATALNALSGKGVHIVTVNDYLAKRDTVWMGQVYNALDLSVGCIAHDNSYIYDPDYKTETKDEELDKKRDEEGSFHIVEEFLRPCSRKEAYDADITYGTNNEFGFDWLRDNLEITKEALRQREHNFAIVDEVDSILIDEARTPLIISAPDAESEDLYKIFSGIVPKLKKEEHYEVDEKLKAATLTEAGIEKVESLLGVNDIYTERGVRYVRHLEQALRGMTIFKRDRDYVVKNGEIIIVDEFTGRLMPGRRWSEGLHQAIEAKEGVHVQKESRTLASITFQNYFRMYKKLSGMTGTAYSSREEFHKVYGLNVVRIPTHKPLIREDLPDAVYQTENGKWQAVIRQIKRCNESGRPVLVGTASIDRNEKLASLLKKEGIKHELLNAKNHEREGEIIAQAGRKGGVTIATNMAGRGVDIILGGAPLNEEKAAEVRNLGGLFVLGTERHEARRIDDQLRGRAGRQGDPGTTHFNVSLEDDLMRVFASERIKKMMGTFGIPEDQPIESKIVSKSIGTAQEKIEGMHFDARKHVLEYDDVLSRQRTSIYESRHDMLFSEKEDIKKKAKEIINSFSKKITDSHIEGEKHKWMTDELCQLFFSITNKKIEKEEIEILENKDDVEKMVINIISESLKEREKKDAGHIYETARMIYLQIIDFLWRDHLEVMEYTRSSVGLRAYGQHDPLVEYKNEAIRLFRMFHDHLENLFIKNLLKAADSESHTHVYSKPRIAPLPPAMGSGAVLNTHNSKTKKVGRNDPCPCGATKENGRPIKYKKCHGSNIS